MGASITLAGESLIAQKHAALQPLKVVRFIYAHVPNLDVNGPVDRAAPKPVANQIVYVYDIPGEQAGYVNPNQVVYSSQIGSDVGDWDFNWIGLETDEGVLFAVSYVPLQIKRCNIPPLQIGNNLTRNFLVAFDGAQALTGITIDASTWQHDFTVRLAGIDERERLSNRDIFGRACFFGSALQVEKVNGGYQLKPGAAYIEGIRLVRSSASPVVPPGFPTTVWLDIALQRELSDVVAECSVVFGEERADYTDGTGVRHYCVPIADLPNTNSVIDRRPVEPITGPLVTHFAARVGDYPDLRARATTKDDVDLGNLPNAKSDSLVLDDSESLATSKAVARLWKSICVQVTHTAVNRVLTAAERGLVVVDAGTDGRTITLPVSNAELGVVDFIVRRADNSGNRVVVQASGNNRIKFHTHLNPEGYRFLVLMGAGDWWHLRSDGAGYWWPVGRYDTTTLGRVVFESTRLFAPGGYGPLNGGLFNRAEWPWLWDHAALSGLAVTEATRYGYEGGWTIGDGVSTFRGPEARAQFLRVLDEAKGMDYGRAPGSSQVDTMQNITGGISETGTSLQSGYGAFAVGSSGSGFWTGPTNYGTDIFTFDASRVVRTSNETRPTNIAYPGRIKLI
ncbi:phage tail protein [Pseudomonas monsensis]|uniref:Phage tail protein n=1 Tax=Pseudomonas monsensis TaxID=2745509 RepID=A0ABT3YZ42_9PSED|nr:phage tail protein [Pseudomonas monsensis]MCY0110725.1 phage tail protein [Pseudomonas monsensis]